MKKFDSSYSTTTFFQYGTQRKIWSEKGGLKSTASRHPSVWNIERVFSSKLYFLIFFGRSFIFDCQVILLLLHFEFWGLTNKSWSVFSSWSTSTSSVPSHSSLHNLYTTQTTTTTTTTTTNNNNNHHFHHHHQHQPSHQRSLKKI